MQINKLTLRLIQVFLLLAILFFCGFYYMMLTKEIIPAFRKEESEQGIQVVQYHISEVKLYANKHYRKDDLDVSHQYGFSLIAKGDSITYASSEVSNGIPQPPLSVSFGSDEIPAIPQDKSNETFYLIYTKDSAEEFSRFPEFHFSDHFSTLKEKGYPDQVEVRQVSTDGKMMIYAVLNRQYTN
ncbi:hypothetical protein LZQ00_03055 [Sphingobacterium sp. SRCM116780]|uniref:hypothetical protein n=1 Tax=Sphingobacterium sp. SRCM116780 TaxID=2907623 RepID=UPI001F43DF3E|nr:hypothetical protein [Sphingobacterium sp. SRCM116780]UIR56803.1 hypothetical protein LZQ00_03055 [Sphingobacterium sp. SRCM116780]